MNKRKTPNWHIAAIYSLTCVFAPILIFFIISIFSCELLSLKNGFYDCSVDTNTNLYYLLPNHHPVFLFFLKIFLIFLVTKHSSSYIKKNYIVTDKKKIVRISALYLVLFIILLLRKSLFTLSTQRVINYFLYIFLFYVISNCVLKNDRLDNERPEKELKTFNLLRLEKPRKQEVIIWSVLIIFSLVFGFSCSWSLKKAEEDFQKNEDDILSTTPESYDQAAEEKEASEKNQEADSIPEENIEIDIPEDWLTYTNEYWNFEVRYPESFNKKYITEYVWPPEITIESFDSNFVCENIDNIKTEDGYGEQKRIFINGLEYCVLTVNQYAAGTAYSTHIYTVPKNDKHITVKFALREVGCSAFDEPIREECNKERDDFNPIYTIDKMVSSFKFVESQQTECEKWLEECAEKEESQCSPCGCRNCCSGLVSRDVTHPYRGENNEVLCLENMTAHICVDCGDGVCSEKENWCICPEDCQKPNPEDLEFSNR